MHQWATNRYRRHEGSEAALGSRAFAARYRGLAPRYDGGHLPRHLMWPSRRDSHISFALLRGSLLQTSYRPQAEGVLAVGKFAISRQIILLERGSLASSLYSADARPQQQ